jgi:hypothetical protein
MKITLLASGLMLYLSEFSFAQAPGGTKRQLEPCTGRASAVRAAPQTS